MTNLRNHFFLALLSLGAVAPRVVLSQNSVRVGQAPPAASEAWQITPQPQSSLVLARDGSLVGEIGR